MTASTTGLNLATINEQGQVPGSRLEDAAEVCGLVDQLIRANEDRAKVDSLVKGLVDGNRPYKSSELKKAAQSDRSNANFREAEAFLSSALSKFYEVFSEAPTYATVELEPDYRTSEERKMWGDIITEEFERLNRKDKRLDSMIQLSQHDMVLYRMGPLIWDDEFDWRSKAIRQSQVLLPDGTPSDLCDWEVCVVLQDYQPHKLYEKIKDSESSGNWNVTATRKAIMNAEPDAYGTGPSMDWEKTQQRIRNNDLCWSAKCNVVKVANVLWSEFPKDDELEGKITHSIVSVTREDSLKEDFLYRKVGAYDSWHQFICPFYYDRGDGTHHSVKGMGIKFYSALELKNRLQNQVVDAAFARAAIMFVPNRASDQHKLKVMKMGAYAALPPGTEVVTANMGGVLDAPMAVTRELLGTVTSNLSQYRQNLQKTDGNPITAREVQFRAEQMSELGKTQLTRYYEQMDDFWSERFRRASNPDLVEQNPGGKEALHFQKRCRDRGVPKEAFKKVRSVSSTRVAGQGSAFLRQSVLQEMLGIVGMLGEGGRQNVIEDYISSKVGYRMLNRYVTDADKAKVTTQDQWDARVENMAMNDGGMLPVVGDQNHLIHMQEHLKASVQGLQSVEKGADPMKVVGFLEAAGAHMTGHLEQLAMDPSRKKEFKAMESAWKEIASQTDQLKTKIQQQQQKAQKEQQEQAQAKAQAQAIGQGQDPKVELDKAKAAAELKIKADTAAAEMEIAKRKAEQDMAIKDAQAAASIRGTMVKSKEK